jgi:hypothetical protein
MPESQNGHPATTVFWATSSYRAMSGVHLMSLNGLGSAGQLYWDNPEANRAANERDLPSWTRGPMHAINTSDSTPGAALMDRRLDPVSSKNITDGTANTLLVGEYHTVTDPTATHSRRTMWAYGYTSYNQSSAIDDSRTLIPDYLKCGPNPGLGADIDDCKRAWGSLHAGNIIQFAKCDGSVTQISQDIDPKVFISLGTIQGEENPVNLP